MAFDIVIPRVSFAEIALMRRHGADHALCIAFEGNDLTTAEIYPSSDRIYALVLRGGEVFAEYLGDAPNAR